MPVNPKYRKAGDPVFAVDQQVSATLLKGLLRSKGLRNVRLSVRNGQITVSTSGRDGIALTGVLTEVQNNGESASDTLEPYDVAAVIPQTFEEVDEFLSMPALRVRVPEAGDLGELVVCVEAIAEEAAGPALYAGAVTPVRLVRDYDFPWPRADIVPGERYLRAGLQGPARLVWEEDAPDGSVAHWAVVELERRDRAHLFEFKNIGASTIPQYAPMTPANTSGYVEDGDPVVKRLALDLPDADDAQPVLMNYGAAVAAGGYGLALVAQGAFRARVASGAEAGDDVGAKSGTDYLEVDQTGFKVTAVLGSQSGYDEAVVAQTGGGGADLPRWQATP